MSTATEEAARPQAQMAELPAAGAPVWPLILSLAWPALLQQGLLLVIQLYDQYLGGYFSPAHLAALTTANYMYWFVTSYTVVVNAGATALVGRLVGADERTPANRAVGQAFLLAITFGLLATLFAVLFMYRVLLLLQLGDEQAGYAWEFLMPLAGLLPFYMVEVAGIACLVGAGDTRTGPKVLATVVVVNVPLAWGLSRGWGFFPDLGFVGIAWGTGLSHVVGCLLVVVTLLRGRYGLNLSLSALMPDGGLIRRLLRVSIPAAVDSLSIGVFQFVFLGIVNSLGPTAASAHGIAIRIEGLGYLSGAAFGTAAVAVVARALGARRPELASRGGWTSLILGASIMSLMGVIFFLFARPLFTIFAPNPDQADIIELGVPVLRLIAFAMPGLAASIVLTQALRGAGDTRVPVLFSWVGFVGVRLPLAYVLTMPEVGMGLIGAWLAMVVDIYVRGAFFLWRFASGRWASIKV